MERKIYRELPAEIKRNIDEIYLLNKYIRECEGNLEVSFFVKSFFVNYIRLFLKSYEKFDSIKNLIIVDIESIYESYFVAVDEELKVDEELRTSLSQLIDIEHPDYPIISKKKDVLVSILMKIEGINIQEPKKEEIRKIIGVDLPSYESYLKKEHEYAFYPTVLSGKPLKEYHLISKDFFKFICSENKEKVDMLEFCLRLLKLFKETKHHFLVIPIQRLPFLFDLFGLLEGKIRGPVLELLNIEMYLSDFWGNRIGEEMDGFLVRKIKELENY